MISMKSNLAGLFFAATLFLLGSGCNAQRPAATAKLEKIIILSEVERIENTLAADDMEGRRINTPGILKAANFISSEFKKIGLKQADGKDNYLQEFALVRPKLITAGAVINGVAIDAKDIMVVTCKEDVEINQGSGFEKQRVGPNANLQTEARKFLRADKNFIVFVSKALQGNFGNLARLRSQFKTDKSVIFILTDEEVNTYEVKAKHEISEQKLFNVLGILPGKSKKDEFVVFSGHYDHLGIGKSVNGDSLYNGANDDAAGVTSMIMLAKYFKEIKDNERTIIFVALTAEESGGYGAQYFSRQFDPAKVIAMFNIEMVGTESKWGRNSAYITGYEKTDMGDILNSDLKGTGFTFYPDPYPTQQLFYRSDNATLARLGVPAHTISTSKMDSEPHYHKSSDEVKTLDLVNMTEIIKAIALSSTSIIAGKSTPSRVKVEDLR